MSDRKIRYHLQKGDQLPGQHSKRKVRITPNSQRGKRVPHGRPSVQCLGDSNRNIVLKRPDDESDNDCHPYASKPLEGIGHSVGGHRRKGESEKDLASIEESLGDCGSACDFSRIERREESNQPHGKWGKQHGHGDS
jgi:hypothetical protein